MAGPSHLLAGSLIAIGVKFSVGITHRHFTRRSTFLAGLLVSILIVPLTCAGAIWIVCGHR